MSSYRTLKPSVGDSSASTSNPAQSTPETSSSDTRRSGRGEKETSSSSKRRRVPDSVTANACLNCKKARAKCDGKRPCKRCFSRDEGLGCIYQVHIKHAKEELVKQITELKARDHLSEQIFQALSHDDKVPDILDRLRKDEPHESIVEWLGRPQAADVETVSPRISHHSLAETSDLEMSGIGTAASSFRWTTVTSSSAVLDHLFQLYFAWVHPVNTLFSEGRFVDSYQSGSDAYCSPMLVNAICAMACHLHSGTDTDVVDFEELGMEFSDAVRAKMNIADRRITTIQAFAVMFLVDCARSNGLRASSYLRIASENLLTIAVQDSDGFQQVCRDTICGIRNLSVEWAQVTFQPPPSIETATYEKVSDLDEELDHANWHFYRYVDDQCPAWPGLLATTNRAKSQLIDIINAIVVMMYSPQGPRVSAHHVLELYERLVTWHAELPRILSDVDDHSSQPLPHVLSLLILYHSSVVQLLRPLLDLDGFPSTLIEDIVWNHAQQGLLLLESLYLRLYTCRYQPVSQMFATLHLTDVVTRFFPGGAEGASKDGPRAIHFGMDALAESRPGFPIASPLLEMLRRTALECSIQLPKDTTDMTMGTGPRASKHSYAVDDFIDACTRITYVQPIVQVHRRYLPTFSRDWAINGASYGFLEPVEGRKRLRVPSAEEMGAQNLMQIRNLLNNA